MSDSTMKKHMKERFGKVNNFCENPPLPKSLNIELNCTCNHKCEFCTFHGKYVKHPITLSVMKTDDAKRILKEAKSLGIGEKEVGFYLAGEAFLHNDFPEIVGYAKELGFGYTFVTSNGSLATPDRMKRVLDAGIDSLRFSVNAADRNTYQEIHGRDDFDVVVENIKFMRKYINEKKLNVATSLSCVITKKTNGIQKRMREIFESYVDDILFIPVMLNNLECDQQYIDENALMDESHVTINPDFICPMLFDTMYIGADLQVMPCCNAYIGDCYFYDLKSDFDLEKAWNCEAYKRYRNIFLNGEDDSETICQDCILRKSGVERLSLDGF